MPPLEEDGPVYGDGPIPVGVHDGFDETEAMAIEEVDQNLLPKIDAMQVGSTLAENRADAMGRDREPIIQFPEDDENQAGEKEVSFGSADVHMTESILGKRAAEEEEVQGERLELSLGLNYGGASKPAVSEMGDRDRLGGQAANQEKKACETKQKIVKTGHTNTGKKARPHVWSRQAQ
jgi:hypothetical protein